MRKLATALFLTSTFLFVGKVDAQPACRFGGNPVSEYRILKAGEEKFIPQEEYLVENMRDGSGKVHPPCIIPVGMKYKDRRLVELVRKGDQVTEVWNCGNPARITRRISPPRQAAPPSASPPSWPPQLSAEEVVLIVINVWRPNEITRKLDTVPGHQSRDLDKEIRDCERQGKCQRINVCRQGQKPRGEYDLRARIEFHNVDFQSAVGTRARRDGWGMTISPRFGPPPQMNYFYVDACDGEGTLAISDKWLRPEMKVPVTFDQKVRMLYPHSTTLRTCTSQEISSRAPHCGGGEPNGEFYGKVLKHRTVHYHFVLSE
ncbi:MAG: hypothetical protein G01um101466_387 [Parcubacteria group bacterium Gr01-1014_66]|nr:MAG: hypothetical protein G01um101466_387 [Parcubacteria group bacterium Gr01-1014_66]